MQRLALLVALAACADSDPKDGAGNPGVDGGTAADAADTTDPQLPPRGHAALTTWLAAGHYLAWTCEMAPHPARPPGAHGTNRICSNTLLSTSDAGTYPLGAASVKEIYSGGAIDGYAVGLKVTTGSDAPSWYWYEVLGTSVVADGAGRPLCANCHADAARDHVFTQVR
jgi:hypothetical protein